MARKKSMNMLELWAASLASPSKTFGEEAKSRHTLARAALHVLVSSIIVVVILALSGSMAARYQMFIDAMPGISSAFWAVLLAAVIVANLLAWLVMSGILHIFAKAFGGRGGYTQQSYLIAIYSAPIAIISAAIGLIPAAGGIINFAISIYSLYLLTIALKITHKYTTGKAVLTWLVPALIILVLIVAAAFLYFSFSMIPPYPMPPG